MRSRRLLSLCALLVAGGLQLVGGERQLQLVAPAAAAPDGGLLAEEPLPLTPCQLLCRAAGRSICRACQPPLPRTGQLVRQRADSYGSWPVRHTLRIIELLLFDRRHLAAYCSAIHYTCVHPLCPCPRTSTRAPTSAAPASRSPPAEPTSPAPRPAPSSAAPHAPTTAPPPPPPPTAQPSTAPTPGANSSLPTTTSTPDKDLICRILCLQGQGGSYCDCMKPPAVTLTPIWAEKSENSDNSEKSDCASRCAQSPTDEHCSCAHAEPGSVVNEDHSHSQLPKEEAKIDKGEAERDKAMTRNQPDPEPDWDLICLELCAIGEGGLLCHCDLPPMLQT